MMARPRTSPAEAPGWPVVLAVAAGGAVGSLARWWLTGMPGPMASDASPLLGWLVLGLVNLSGSFLLGALGGWSSRRSAPRWLVSGLGVGVLGSYTSLSAVVLAASVAMAPGVDGSIAGAVLALLALVVGAALGTAAAAAGLWAAGWRRA
ncbi:CrcB family protein [Citricoccus sp. GCM10030269]|uniref:FluC/FEX family fluoride channel n=1 Tax=Citricoccus sp. GCM10030269 TaxID=3273388 RepID=UPI00360D8F3E